MNTRTVSLSRRNAGLPTLEALAPELRNVSSSLRALTAVLPLVTLAAFATAFAGQWYWLLPPIVLAHFVVLVAYLHDVAHGTAGLSAKATHWVLFVMGAILLQSGHAFRYNHLYHHTHCLEDDDLEGAPARMGFIEVLLAGPGYLPRLWLKAVRETSSPRERRWMMIEMTSASVVPCMAIAAFEWSAGPLIYCAFVYVGSWAYPLTTAYLPHYKPGEKMLEQARTLRGRLVPALFMNLTYHLEHHLYPQVPSLNLVRLADRLEPYYFGHGFKPGRVF